MTLHSHHCSLGPSLPASFRNCWFPTSSRSGENPCSSPSRGSLRIKANPSLWPIRSHVTCPLTPCPHLALTHCSATPASTPQGFCMGCFLQMDLEGFCSSLYWDQVCAQMATSPWDLSVHLIIISEPHDPHILSLLLSLLYILKLLSSSNTLHT